MCDTGDAPRDTLSSIVSCSSPPVDAPAFTSDSAPAHTASVSASIAPPPSSSRRTRARFAAGASCFEPSAWRKSSSFTFSPPAAACSCPRTAVASTAASAPPGSSSSEPGSRCGARPSSHFSSRHSRATFSRPAGVLSELERCRSVAEAADNWRCVCSRPAGRGSGAGRRRRRRRMPRRVPQRTRRWMRRRRSTVRRRPRRRRSTAPHRPRHWRLTALRRQKHWRRAKAGRGGARRATRARCRKS